MRFSAQKVPSDMFMGVRIGMVSATMRPPDLRARFARLQLPRDALGDGGVDRQHVPVQRTARRRAHLHEQIDLVVAELVEAARDDRLDLRALVLADRPGKGQQFGGFRVPRGDRLPVAVGVRGGLGGGQSPCSGGHRLMEEPQHLWSCSSVGCPPTASAPITYRRSAQCPTMKPALTAMRPSRASRYSPKPCQFQGAPSSRATRDMPSTLDSMRRV